MVRRNSSFCSFLICGIIFWMFAHVDAGRYKPANEVFNVLSFGAVGDGHRDDSQAFLKAWTAACQSREANPTMIIPGGRTYFLTPLTFKGHCKSANILVKVDGNIVAPESPDAWNGLDAHLWISFTEVNGLIVSGGGTIDGRGKRWWDQSCRYHPGPGCTKLAPMVLRFVKCNNTLVKDIHVVNSPQTHVLVMGANLFTMQNVNIHSPADTANTDGVHVHIAEHVFIHNSTIGSGDDCISIGDHIDDIHIDNINCGPGHGISIGSLGIDGGEAKVQNIRVTNSRFRETTNGIRIKTYQGGNGYAKDFHFKNLNFDTVSNPIIIDQYYCAVRGACPPQKTAVQIKNVTYEHFTGTSATQAAVVLNCSQAVPCTELTFNSIQLTPAKRGETVKSVCINAHGEKAGLLQPNIPCLLN
ncbi:hypothetical protein C5167_035413 [Papaver somniferum]|uniref:endo-polygalacturonase n=1 Tax=Papaver somniferum TaxID=3469 RepID=A0A4Y7KHC8_PAPSO|nr:probable polygalacturonase At1g80170 [Papaver somniferum]RZC72247.1 hypothetical protein C5167_035413 [Papaver somniferum]